MKILRKGIIGFYCAVLTLGFMQAAYAESKEAVKKKEVAHKEQVAGLTRDNEVLAKKVKELETAVLKNKTSVSKEVQGQQEQLKKENVSLSKELTAKTKAMNDLDKQLAICKDSVNTLGKDKASMQTKFGQDLKKAISQSATTTQEKASLHTRLQEAMKEKEGLKAQVVTLKNAVGILQKEKAILETMMAAQPQTLRFSQPRTEVAKSLKNEVHLNLGYAYALKGNAEKAIQEYRKALHYDPQNRDVHYNLGYLLARQNRFQEAVEEYKKSLSGSTTDREVYYNLAILYAVNLKEPKLAQMYYNKFLEYSSDTSALE
ncbi:MAG: tetratricopeptide repeat protein [Candidatus Omnitrophota bacterium]|nr:MAG: tetratricopeptide repeat protein [Candidatus Omnitrophota bacterium]